MRAPNLSPAEGWGSAKTTTYRPGTGVAALAVGDSSEMNKACSSMRGALPSGGGRHDNPGLDLLRDKFLAPYSPEGGLG
ncbi:hypothetical protein GCM10017711_02700 [Paeniglutamicibacter sulfureus]